MSRSLSRRHARTEKSALAVEPKIEREKIRRPPSQTPRHVADETLPETNTRSRTSSADTERQDSDYHDSAHADWTIDHSEAATWDDDTETDWVFDPSLDDAAEELSDDEEVVDAYAEDDDSGVVWEAEDDFPDQMTFDEPSAAVIEDDDDIAFDDDGVFDDDGAGFGPAPEVELAGRRDVSPRAPKPVSAGRGRSTGQAHARQANPQQRGSRPRQTGRERASARDVLDNPTALADSPLEAIPTPAPTPRSTGRPAEIEPVERSRAPAPRSARSSGRARSARAPAEDLVIGDAPDRPSPQPSGGGAGRRRRQPAMKVPVTLPSNARYPARRRRRSGMGLLPLVVVVVIGIVGWFGYQRIDPAAFQPTIDRVTSWLPFPSTTRTAEDSSFSDGQRLENLTAEQALSSLEDRALSDDVAAPSVAPTNGPHIPKFKPLSTGEQSLPSTTRSITEPDKTNETAQDVSIIEQIIRYINPG